MHDFLDLIRKVSGINLWVKTSEFLAFFAPKDAEWMISFSPALKVISVFHSMNCHEGRSDNPQATEIVSDIFRQMMLYEQLFEQKII